MKILLINCDADFNIALSKLYRYYLNNGDDVRYCNCGFDYYNDNEPKRYFDGAMYDMIYVSAIYDNSLSKIRIFDGDGKINIGGIGSGNNGSLPSHIHNLEPYNISDVYQNFITRGCIRHCSFCKVRDHEGYIYLDKHPCEMELKSTNLFWDNNILGYSQHKDILRWLNDNGIKYQFKQGLDFRLVNDENLRLLADARYYGDYIFAFDFIEYRSIVKKAIDLIRQYIERPFKTKWYCYVNINDPVTSINQRVRFLKDNECLPYVMRDKNCYAKSDKAQYLTMLSAYCNQPAFFKKMEFSEFVSKRTNNERIIDICNTMWRMV